MAEPWTSVYIDRFQITSEPAGPATLTYLYTDALLGAGQQEADWQQVQQDPRFRFGIGAISKAANPRAKWNVTGSSFTLWAPVGPGFGQARVLVDGAPAGQIDFHADRDGPSRPLFILKDLPPGCHALVLKGAAGAMPVDCLDVHSDQP